jgi:dTDP-4-amino-4,6-dideoxygalactose transaminase
MFRATPRHNINLTSSELRLVIDGALGRLKSDDGRQQFETEAQRFFGVAHAIAVESGRAALHMALAGLRLPAGAEIVLPRYCFFSLVKVIEGMGYRPRFAPVDPQSFALDPGRLAAHTDGADAVIVIHPFGQLADMAGLQAVCATRGLPLIEDASQATGARWGRHRAGAIGDVGVFSLVSGKNLQTFGGGLLLTQDDHIARAIRRHLVSAVPMDTSAVQSALRSGLQRWFVTTPLGYKTLMHPLSLTLATLAPAKLESLTHEEQHPYDPTRLPRLLSDTQGTLGCMELAELDRRNAARRSNALRMLAGLKGLHGIHLPQFDPTVENSFNAVAIRTVWAPELASRLRRAGFDTRSDYMEWFGEGQDFEQPVIYLPNHPAMCDADIDRLVKEVRCALSGWA